MRPIDIFYQAQKTIRKVLRVVRLNPGSEQGRQAIANEMQRQARRAAEKIELPKKGQIVSQTPSIKPSVIVSDSSLTSDTNSNNLYRAYNCVYNNPLACEQPLQTQKKATQAKFCSRCAFPVPLANTQEIRGRRGTYQVECLLGKRGKGRIYRGVQTNNHQPIIIKEYLLPNRSFTEVETRQNRQDTFIQVAGFSTIDGVASDSRSILPLEAIADREKNACYLITKGDLGALPTLNNYLAEHGAMSAEQVLNLLDQVLQTLEFLHEQKLQFPYGQIQQGLVHGNLNLDNLLVATKQRLFFYYLCDFSVWEDLFDPAISQATSREVVDDLVALGYVGFYALAGKAVDPQDKRQWRSLDPNLKRFLLQLLGLNSRFDNATVARTKLRYLSLENKEQSTIFDDEDREIETRKTWLPWTIGASLLLLLGLGGWLISNNHLKSDPVTTANGISLTDKISDVTRVPEGNFNYGLLKPGTAYNLFVGKKLSRVIVENQPQLTLNHQVQENTATAIASIEPESIDFALINSTDEGRIENGQLISKAISHDGLLVFVPSDSAGGLAKYLAGKITVEQLRQLYTGKITSWQQIAKNAPDLPVKLFIPTEATAVELFEQLILQNQDDIAQFRKLWEQNKIEQLESLETLQQIRKDYEPNRGNKQPIGGIAFGSLNRVFKQCNGYPLSVVKDSKQIAPILIRNDSTPVNLFQNVRCKDKQSYHLNEAIFRDRTYPLSFNLSMVYPNDNQYEIGVKMTEIFKTRQVQCLIHNNNLIPLQSLTKSDCDQSK